MISLVAPIECFNYFTHQCFSTQGAQSGGVVTFEPAQSGLATDSNTQAPILRGVRSRVVNAKRTVLSNGVRRKIEKDNCSVIGNKLSGWSSATFNPNNSGKRIVRGFFGHTRFATVRFLFFTSAYLFLCSSHGLVSLCATTCLYCEQSSKATMDGTHPHTWSPRRFYTFYPFQSASAAAASSNGHLKSRRAVGTGMPPESATSERNKIEHLAPKSQSIGVENFVTHNGKLSMQ